MKTLFALIFSISVILLVYLSSATNKGDQYMQILIPVDIYKSVECMEDCAGHQRLVTIPAETTVKLLARLKGQRKMVARVEYQQQAGWFTVTESNAKVLDPKVLTEKQNE